MSWISSIRFADEPPLLHVRANDRAAVEALLAEARRPASRVTAHA